LGLTDGIEIDINWVDKDLLRACWENVYKMVTIIQHDIYFAKDGAGNLYYYHEGVYKPKGEEALMEMYLKLLAAVDRKEEFKKLMPGALIMYVGINAPMLWDRPKLEWLNLLNGIYDWGRMELLPHTPENLTTVQIPINYDSTAECPKWDTFLEEIFPEGVTLMREVIGLCMTPFMGLHKCIVLVGGGSNGKSTFLNAVETAIGKQNICNLSLQKLTDPRERFSSSGIVGKLVNIFSDLSARKIEDTSNFKALTGQDSLTIEIGHKNQFSYTPFCKLIFSCNEVVKSDDDSVGYKRRFIHIPFVKPLKVDPKKGEEIAYNLAQPRELSGLLNKIIPRLPFIIEDGFTITEEIAAMVDNYCPIPDITKTWLLTNFVEDPEGILPSSMFYNYYCSHCIATEPFDRSKLIQYMKTLFPGIIGVNQVTRIWKGLNPVRCYRGVKAIDPEVQAIIMGDAMVQAQNWSED